MSDLRNAVLAVRRFGNWTLNLTPPDQAPATRLDLEPRVLFAPKT